MKLSKAYKAAHYDEIASEREKYMLALHDLVNGKLSKAVSVKERDYIKDGAGTLSMRLSWRGMPLFLSEYRFGNHTTVNVFTESELEDISRDAHASFHCMLRDLFYQCKRDLYPKAA